MENYKELFEIKTAEEIFQLFKDKQHEKKTQEANRLRTAFIMYHAAESEEVNYLNAPMLSLLAEESVFADLLQSVKNLKKPDGSPLVLWSKKEMCGIRAFLDLKKYLAVNHTNGILVAQIHLTTELKQLEATNEEMFNATVLFDAYAGIRVEHIVPKYAKHLEQEYPIMRGVSSFILEDSRIYEERLKTRFEQLPLIANPAEKEAERILQKGFLLCFTSVCIYKNDKAGAEDFLTKALSITNEGEYEYNLIRFLLKEIRIKTA